MAPYVDTFVVFFGKRIIPIHASILYYVNDENIKTAWVERA
jgi:hypothetical protein